MADTKTLIGKLMPGWPQESPGRTVVWCTLIVSVLATLAYTIGGGGFTSAVDSVNKVGPALERLGVSIDNASASTAALRGQVGELSRVATTLGDKVESLEDSVRQNTVQGEALSARLERLEARLAPRTPGDDPPR